MAKKKSTDINDLKNNVKVKVFTRDKFGRQAAQVTGGISVGVGTKPATPYTPDQKTGIFKMNAEDARALHNGGSYIVEVI